MEYAENMINQQQRRLEEISLKCAQKDDSCRGPQHNKDCP